MGIDVQDNGYRVVGFIRTGNDGYPEIQDKDYHVVGRISGNGEIQDNGYHVVGRISRNGEIQDNDYHVVGYAKGASNIETAAAALLLLGLETGSGGSSNSGGGSSDASSSGAVGIFFLGVIIFRIVIIAVIAAVVLGGGLLLFDKLRPATDADTITVTSDSLNFRSGPGTDSKVIKTLKKGDTLTFKIYTRTQKGWLPVKHDGDKGYVSEEMVAVHYSFPIMGTWKVYCLC